MWYIKYVHIIKVLNCRPSKILLQLHNDKSYNAAPREILRLAAA